MSDTPLTRRQAIQTGVASVAGMAAATRTYGSNESLPVVQLGLVTDVHHADKETWGSRHYRDSLPKLQVALQTFVDRKVDTIVQLGDLIDAHETVPAEEQALQKVTDEFTRTGIPYHFVLGNHCLALLSKQRYASLAGVKDRHYQFELGPLQVVVLDANYRADGTSYDAGNFDWRDCFLPSAQLEWLGDTLRASRKPTVIVTHQRLDPSPNHHVANHEQVRKVVADAGGGRVKAVLQGHSHKNHRAEFDGIPYLVLRAVIEGGGLENNAYAILSLHDDGAIHIEGFGQQDSCVLA